MNTTIELTPAMMTMIPIIVWLVKQIKGIIEPYTWFDKAKRFLPVASIGLGIGLSYLFGIENPVVAGILEAMTAIAGYEALKDKNPRKPYIADNGNYNPDLPEK